MCRKANVRGIFFSMLQKHQRSDQLQRPTRHKSKTIDTEVFVNQKQESSPKVKRINKNMSSFRPRSAQVQKHGQSMNVDRIISREIRLFNRIQILWPQEEKKTKETQKEIPQSRPSRLWTGKIKHRSSNSRIDMQKPKKTTTKAETKTNKSRILERHIMLA